MARKAMTVDLEKLVVDLRAAREAAEKAVSGMSDGGTCCFDHPVLNVRLTTDVAAACTAAGFHADHAYGHYRGWVSLNGFPGSHAQGGPRTVGAEAVDKTLRERGWSASVYYAMD